MYLKVTRTILHSTIPSLLHPVVVKLCTSDTASNIADKVQPLFRQVQDNIPTKIKCTANEVQHYLPVVEGIQIASDCLEEVFDYLSNENYLVQ